MPVNTQTRTKLDKKIAIRNANGASSLGDLRSVLTDVELDSLVLTGNLEVTGTVSQIDLNGAADALIIDADADTTISAPTDDQIDIEISGADDFRFTANTFTSLSGSTIATNTIAETTAASGVTVDGLVIKDSTFQYNATGFFGVTKTNDATLTIDETGFVFGNKATALTLTLPATVVGYSYFIVNIDGTAVVNVDPAAADYIGGAGLTKVDNKDLIIPAVKGAYAQIIADGVNGWYIAQASGTLTKEA